MGTRQITGDNVFAFIDFLTGSTPAYREGRVFYDDNNKSLAVYNDESDITLQVGQELYMRVRNETGATIGNGIAVYINGASSGLPTIARAQANDEATAQVAGIATHSIENNTVGYITSFGLLRDVNTGAFTGGEPIYLSPTVAGSVTLTKPTYPNYVVLLGYVANVDASTGSFMVKPGPPADRLGDTAEANAAANERTGFVLTNGAPTEVSLSFDDGTRTFQIAPTGSDFRLYIYNAEFVKTTESVVWTDVEGPHYFYYDTSGVLQHATTFDVGWILGNTGAFVAYLIWDATGNQRILDGFVECHGLQMDGADHVHWHNVVGSQVYEGGTLSGFSSDQSGALDAHAQFAVDTGTYADEDLRYSASAVASTTGLPILYVDSSGNTRQITESGFSVVTDTTAGVGATGRICYNDIGGGGGLVVVGNNDFVLCHVFVIYSNTDSLRYFATPGIATYNTISDARAAVDGELNTLAGAIEFAEVRPLGSVIFQTANSYTNSVKARVRTDGDGNDYVDKRFSSFGGGGSTSVTEHNNLSGRSAPGTHPTLEAPENTNQVIKLADNAGAYRLDINDSDNSEVATIDSDGNTTLYNTLTVEFGGLSAQIGADNNLRTVSNNTEKRARVSVPHYTSGTEEPVNAITLVSNATVNSVRLGGGSDDTTLNTATEFEFWLGASTTDTTGSVAMSLTTAGLNLQDNDITNVGSLSADSATLDNTGVVPLVVRRNGGTDANTAMEFDQSTGSWYWGVNASNELAARWNNSDLSSPELKLDSSGNLTVTGTVTGSGGGSSFTTTVDIANNEALYIGSDVGATTRTNNTDKNAQISMPHYTSATADDFNILTAQTTSSQNRVSIGLGGASLNAATEILLYAASTTTSGTGNLVISVTDGGVSFNSADISDVGSLDMDLGNITSIGAAVTPSSQLTISSGAVTATRTYHTIATEGGAGTDDLVTINTSLGAGHILVIQAADTNDTVVAKQGTGNLRLNGDFSMNNIDDTMTLIYNGTNWLELSRSDNGS